MAAPQHLSLTAGSHLVICRAQPSPGSNKVVTGEPSDSSRRIQSNIGESLNCLLFKFTQTTVLITAFSS
jgi:hypothetical protein